MTCCGPTQDAGRHRGRGPDRQRREPAPRQGQTRGGQRPLESWYGFSGEGYHRLIPDDQRFAGKDLTVSIEQDNSNIRHFLARFRRRTKVASKAVVFWAILRLA